MFYFRNTDQTLTYEFDNITDMGGSGLVTTVVYFNSWHWIKGGFLKMSFW